MTELDELYKKRARATRKELNEFLSGKRPISGSVGLDEHGKPIVQTNERLQRLIRKIVEPLEPLDEKE